MAAGQSRRMGVPKLSIPLGDKGPLGGMALREAAQSGLDDIFVVTRSGERPDWYPFAEGEAAGERCFLIPAPEAELGMALSIRAGLSAAADNGPYDAVVVLLADQPLLRADMIDRLLAAYRADPSLEFAAWADRGEARPPVLFAASVFDTLRRLAGDEGARKLLTGSRLRGKLLEGEAAWFTDLDTPLEVKLFIERYVRSG
ncbi:nucleotidyltransferase family protein [Paenibacillus validus]|uniref:nucleotidyltransferase family protein n=1 Tax=Paenibacillus validus TaxID=44253 RepID=UPI000FDBAC25|nr:nucleotidyltransferase family protein [Paenibacillus validus]